MGRDLPEYPTLFAKFPEALIGPHDPIALAPDSEAVDWEAELAVVIGAPVRRAPDAEAAAAASPVSPCSTTSPCATGSTARRSGCRARRSRHTTPFGPRAGHPRRAARRRPARRSTCSCTVDGDTVQKANTADLVFDPVTLVAYISTILTLQPGDVIATGTPGGVGHARKPPRYLADGAVLTTEFQGLGGQRNTARVRASAPVPA